MRQITVLTVVLLLGACSRVQVSDYSGFEPPMVPESFFSGPLTAHGVIKNRGGRVIRTFSATIDADWNDGVGTLDEDFLFDDGEEQTRIWTLTAAGDGVYNATAGDVVGTGSMEVSGNSVFLDYVLSIPYGDGTVDVRVDDRMYLVAPHVLINESKMKKFGVEVGSILLVILREPQERPDE